jgi:alpha-glutamyl/putrescinyl thymine pyrophosphorylase clade 1
MSLFAWFSAQLLAPAIKEKDEAAKVVPASTEHLNRSDNEEFAAPHSVSPDTFSPATKSEILLDPDAGVVASTPVDSSTQEKETDNVDMQWWNEQVNKRIRSLNSTEQKYPIGTRVKKYFYGYDTPFWGIVTRYDPRAQYYGVHYVADGDEEEYDEFEMSQIAVSGDHQKGVTDDLPKYGIGTEVGKWFDSEFYFGIVTSYDAHSLYYLITYEDGDKEEVEELEMLDLIAAVQKNWDYKKGDKKKRPRLSKPEEVVATVKDPVQMELVFNPEDLNLWANIGLVTESEIAAVLKQMTMAPVSQRRSVAEFFLFIYLRQEWFRECRQQKLTSVPAFTPNRVIREHDFCNIYRELDEDAHWLRQCLAELYSGEEMTRREWTLQVLWVCYNYRQVGRTETFLALGFPKLMFHEPQTKSGGVSSKSALTMEQFNNNSVKTFLKGMRKLMSKGCCVFTGDYQTPPMRLYEKFVMKVIANDCALLHNVADAILEYDPNDKEFDFFTYHKNICTDLQVLPGIASFFGWQLFCDLEEAGCIPRHPSMSLARLKEERTEPPFVLLGGDARKGLNKVFGHGTVPYAQQLEEVNFMIQNQLLIYKALGLQFDYWNGQAISCKVLEYVCAFSFFVFLGRYSRNFRPFRHALCEYFQYCRLVERKMKSIDRSVSRHRKASPNIGPVSKCSSCSKSSISFLCDTCGQPYCGKCWPKPVSESSTMICAQCQCWTRRYEALPW